MVSLIPNSADAQELQELAELIPKDVFRPQVIEREFEHPKIPAIARARQMSRRLAELQRLKNEFIELAKFKESDPKTPGLQRLTRKTFERMQTAGRRTEEKVFEPLRAALRFCVAELPAKLPEDRAKKILDLPAQAEEYMVIYNTAIEEGDVGEIEDGGVVYTVGNVERALAMLEVIADRMKEAAEYAASQEEFVDDPDAFVRNPRVKVY